MESLNALVTSVLPPQRAVVAEPPAIAPSVPAAAATSRSDKPTPAVSHGAPGEVDVEQLNALLQQHQQHLAFSVDEGSGRSVIKVIDTASGDVIRQMPSESWLKLAQELARQAGGLLRTQA